MPSSSFKEDRDEPFTEDLPPSRERGSDVKHDDLKGGDGDSNETATAAITTTTYDALKVIGHGSFGCVFLAKVEETGELVAIKKVLQDPRFKNRESQVMKILSKTNPNPFIVRLKHYFFSGSHLPAKPSESININTSTSGTSAGIMNESGLTATGASATEDTAEDGGGGGGGGRGGGAVYLNLVMEYIPENLYNLIKHFARSKRVIPIEHTRLYMFQLARALTHVHALGICHRDIKPQNLLIDPDTLSLKLCDFGSSKLLVKGEPNVAYICSRYYRAPELIFGSNNYSTAVDMWSYGCVFAELLLGSPIFPGGSGVDHLVEIIKVLGSPNKEELRRMNPNYQDFKFPNIQAHALSSVFPDDTDALAVSLCESLLRYVPEQRSSAVEILFCPFHLPVLSSRTYVMPEGSALAGLPLPAEFLAFTETDLVAASALGQEYVDALTAAAGESSL